MSGMRVQIHPRCRRRPAQTGGSVLTLPAPAREQPRGPAVSATLEPAALLFLLMKTLARELGKKDERTPRASCAALKSVLIDIEKRQTSSGSNMANAFDLGRFIELAVEIDRRSKGPRGGVPRSP
jgi:hypothetical protein